MGFAIFVIIAGIFLYNAMNEWFRNSELTRESKYWAQKSNRMTYIDFHKNKMRDTHTNVVSREYLGQDRNGRYFNYLVDEKGNITRAKYLNGSNDPVDLVDRKM